ncbi:MAG: hypothetical protein HY432_00225 [Candidatus Liptonbacteria bacterium]|nr:hypothetical protein [Candidatus Liptonbacteria bacterium]
MKNFSLKFIDILIGMVLGLGFQWWPLLQYPWQYMAFIFVYFDIVDYWIDYSPSLKKFPPKREIDVMLDVAIMFVLFLYIYATQLTVVYFLAAFIIWRVLDYFWLLSSKYEYSPVGTDKLFVDTWMQFNLIEAAIAAVLIGGAILFSIESLIIVIAFIVFRVIVRILASMRYKKVHFA